MGFHCECGNDGGCAEMVWMTLPEYEVVRRTIASLAPGHENDELEQVVARNERFVIVDKIADAEPYVMNDRRGRALH